MNTSASASRIYVVEDDLKFAKQYIRQSGLYKIMDDVAYITDFDSLVDHILMDEAPKVFWIDINLGEGREEEGIDMISITKKKCPGSFVIAYTAYKEHEERCKSAGADAFFVKGRDYEEIMENIYMLVNRFLKANGIDVNTVEYKGEIAHIDEDWVKIECHYQEEEIDRFFPVGPVRSAMPNNFKVGVELKIRITTKNSEIKVSFEAVDAEPVEDEIIDLMDSEIWKKV